jgi:hypothetical protein
LDKKESKLPVDACESQEISRREALAKLAKYSAYTAPAVMTLMASRPSMAQITSCSIGTTDGEGIPGDPIPGQPVDPSGATEPNDHPGDIAKQEDSEGVSGDPNSKDTDDVPVIINDTSADCSYIR